MKNQIKHLLIALTLLSALNSQLLTAFAQGTAFTYQGQLNDGGSPATGSYDLTFALFSDSNGVSQVGGTVTNTGIAVNNGLFTLTLDFGPGIFNGTNYWLQIGAETNGGGGSFTLLTPLQPLTPTPYAIYAASVGTASSAITANGVVANAVTGAGIASGSVVKSLNALQDAVTLAAGTNVTITPSGNTLTIASTGTIGPQGPAGSATNAWKLTGNAGTSPASGNFMGTTDNQPLEMHVNGQRGMRLEPTATDANHSGIVNVVNGASVNFAAPGVYGATISGGGAGNYLSLASTNNVTADYGTVGGGRGNTSSGQSATVGGGLGNTSSGDEATVGGGVFNIASGPGAFVGGGGYDGSSYSLNTASGGASTVAGGIANWAANTYATVGGGEHNVSGGLFATVGGGLGNNSSGNGAAVGGGEYNHSSGLSATVGGGISNTVSGPGAFVGGGGYDGSSYSGNTAMGGASTIAGGFGNFAANTYATVPGGANNVAGGYYSFAAGQQAHANNQGDFVWADSQNAVFASTANDQFCIRAQGGVQLDPHTSIFCGSQTRQMFNLWSTNYGIGVQNSDMYYRSGSEFFWYIGGSHNDAYANPGGGTQLMRLANTGNLIVTGTVTANGVLLTSDRNVKESFTEVDAQAVLEKVAAMPVSEWQFKTAPGERHLGPMAQDFHAAFGLGTDDKHIAVIDEGGVALAAIQGLNQKLESEAKEKDAEIQELKQRLEALEKIVLNQKSN